ncbi:MAG: hypothetical protein H8E12_12830 [Rhodobacteraceae bacterium]|nr:hypothetical protein [Paracoccaceae bacterium]
MSIVTNNYNKTHPITDRFNYRKEGNDKEYRPSIHSELSAWLKLGKEDCGDLTFVNIRVNNNEKLGMSKPCDGCKSLLDKVGYKNFYYTNNNGELVEL